MVIEISDFSKQGEFVLRKGVKLISLLTFMEG